MSTHPFAVGDKIRFNRQGSDFNSRFLARFFEDSDGVVTVTDAVTEPDGYTDDSMTHYVRLAEDTESSDESGLAPIWNVNWFEDQPVAPPTAEEAPMTDTTTTREFKVGDKVRVTDQHGAVIGASGLQPGQTYVGATATITETLVADSEWGSYALEFDDKSLSSFGTWSTRALDLIEEASTERPTIDFSGSSRSTAREYAKDANTRLLSPPQQALLKRVAAGEQVDAYALNEVLLAAMRATLTRHGASTQRRVTGRKIAYLGHITQAVLENHADGLPVYAAGDRSRAVEEAKTALTEAREEVDRVVRDLRRSEERLSTSEQERAQFLLAMSDERRRLCAEIDQAAEALQDEVSAHAEYRRLADDEVSRLLAVSRERDSLLADTVTERDRVAEVLDYALGFLQHADKQRVLGFWDGRDESRLEAGE